MNASDSYALHSARRKKIRQKTGNVRMMESGIRALCVLLFRLSKLSNTLQSL